MSQVQAVKSSKAGGESTSGAGIDYASEPSFFSQDFSLKWGSGPSYDPSTVTSLLHTQQKRMEAKLMRISLGSKVLILGNSLVLICCVAEMLLSFSIINQPIHISRIIQYMKRHYKEFTHMQTQLDNISTYVFVIAIVTSFSAIVGIIIAIRRSKGTLILLLSIVLFDIITQLAFKVYLHASKNSRYEVLKYSMKDSMQQYVGNNTVRIMWDEIMNKTACCGTETFKEFKTLPEWNDTFPYEVVPQSCCKGNNKSTNKCTKAPKIQDSNKKRPCYRDIWRLVFTRYNSMYGVLCICVVLMICVGLETFWLLLHYI